MVHLSANHDDEPSKRQKRSGLIIKEEELQYEIWRRLDMSNVSSNIIVTAVLRNTGRQQQSLFVVHSFAWYHHSWYFIYSSNIDR